MIGGGSMRCVSIVLAGLALACADACTPAVSRTYRSSAVPSRCSLSAPEIHRNYSASLYEVLQEIRPSMLRRNLRGELPLVVLDGAVVGDASALLHTLPATQVRSVRRLDEKAATQRYGLHQTNAVLEVQTGAATQTDTSAAPAPCS